MFKYLAIRKYQKRLVPVLKKRFPEVKEYTASHIRTVVYQNAFSPNLLPLGYMMLLSQKELTEVLEREFPFFNAQEFLQEHQLDGAFIQLPANAIAS